MYYQQQQPKPQQKYSAQAREVKQTLMEMFGELGEEIITIILQENKYQLEPTLEALLKISDQKGGAQNFNNDEEDDTIFDFRKKNEQNKNKHAQINQLKGEDDGIQVDLEEDDEGDDENEGQDEYGDQAFEKNQKKNQYNNYSNNNSGQKTAKQIQEEEDMKLAYALQQKYMQQEKQQKQQMYAQQQNYQNQNYQQPKKQQKQNNNQQNRNQYPNYNQNYNDNDDGGNQRDNDLQDQDQDMLPEGFQYQNNYQDLIKPKKSVKQKLTDAKKKFMRLFNKKKKNQSTDNKNNQQQEQPQQNDDEFVGQLIDFEDEGENLHKK